MSHFSLSAYVYCFERDIEGLSCSSTSIVT